jgi:hypothetical protein
MADQVEATKEWNQRIAKRIGQISSDPIPDYTGDCAAALMLLNIRPIGFDDNNDLWPPTVEGWNIRSQWGGVICEIYPPFGHSWMGSAKLPEARKWESPDGPSVALAICRAWWALVEREFCDWPVDAAGDI